MNEPQPTSSSPALVTGAEVHYAEGDVEQFAREHRDAFGRPRPVSVP